MSLKNLMFVFDRMPDQDGCIFIEVENAEGQSVCAGEWRGRDDGLVELVVPVNYDDAQRLRADTAEAERDDLKNEVGQVKGEYDRAVNKLTAAEQSIAELTKSFEKFRDVVRGCERLASQYSPCIDAVDEGGGDDNDDPTLAIFHRLYYAMFDADAALNPKPEAGSQ